MFGIDESKVKAIEAAIDPVKIKAIQDRADWITQCAVLIVQKAAQWFKIELPPAP